MATETQTPIETLRVLAKRYHSDSVHALVNHTAHDLASCGNEVCTDARAALADVEAEVAALERFRITYGPNEHFIQCGGSHNIPANPATYPITRCEQAQAAHAKFTVKP